MSGNDFRGQRWRGGYNRLFLERDGLFSGRIDSVVFREADVARDPDESDLGVN